MTRPVNGDATDTCGADPARCWDCRGEPVCIHQPAAPPAEDATQEPS